VPVLYSYAEQLSAWAKRRFAAPVAPASPAAPAALPVAGASMPEQMPASKE
jgi:hypothetical protein